MRDDYQAFRGWEEGVVEQLQRLLRPVILETLGVVVPAEVFGHRETMHSYNIYVSALEEIRAALAAESVPTDPETFYANLLRTPLRERPGAVLALGYQNTLLPRAPFVRAFSAANAVLTRRLL